MLKIDIKKLLAITILTGFFLIILALFFVPIPPPNLDLLKTMVIALIAIATGVGGYYYGSSDGSARKTELMLPPPFFGADYASGPDKTVTAMVERTSSEAGYIRLPALWFLLAAFACIVALSGCATTSQPGATKDTPLQTAGKSLLAVKSTIVVAATATDNLCKLGKIAPDNCHKAKIAYEVAKPAYDTTVDAYLLMSSGGGAAVNFDAALLRVQNLAAHLLQLSGGAQ